MQWIRIFHGHVQSQYESSINNIKWMFGWISNNVTKHGITSNYRNHDSVVYLDFSFKYFNRGWDRRERWRGWRDRDRGEERERAGEGTSEMHVESVPSPLSAHDPAAYKGQSHYSDEEKGKTSHKLWYYCTFCYLYAFFIYQQFWVNWFDMG